MEWSASRNWHTFDNNKKKKEKKETNKMQKKREQYAEQEWQKYTCTAKDCL